MMATEHRIDGHTLTLLKNGTEFFPALCAAIDSAQLTVALETYIFADDETGRMVAMALQRAALRGVAVRLLLDGFGSAELSPKRIDELRIAGVEVQWFRREPAFLSFRRNRLRRLHRKIAVIDSEIAFIGGINILDDIPSGAEFDIPRFDYAVKMEGMLVAKVNDSVRHLWGVVSRVNQGRRVLRFLRYISGTRKRGTTRHLAFVVRDSIRHRRDIERAYLQAIGNAQKEIILANAYFLPGRSFRKALKLAAARGVRVVMLLQGRVEYWLQHHATRELYGELLAAGIEIYEYQASFLHAKVAVIDSAWATVGSSNIDPFSLFLAKEANLVVRDSGFAEQLRDSLQMEIAQHAVQIKQQHAGIAARVMSRISYTLIRWVIGLLGIARRK